jgi:hypothetical protein
MITSANGRGEAGVDRAVAEDLLHVEGDEEEHREQRGADEQPDHVGAGQRPDSEDRERHQRFGRAQLDRDEQREQQCREDDQADRLERAPAGAVGVDQRVDQGREPGGDGDGAGDVEGARPLLVAAFGDQARGEGEGDQAHRDVDPEHPLPAEPFGEDSAEEDARRAAGAGDRAPDAQRPVALGAVAEGGRDDRERRRRDDRGAEALGGAGGDQLALGRREPGEQRGDPDQQQAGHEDAPATEQVGGAAAEQEEAAEGEDIGVDDPGQVFLGEVERPADRGQRDVDDRGVEDDDELGRTEQDQRQPPLVL